MKTQPLQSFNRTEIALIVDALRGHMFKVSKPSARMILSDYVKVLSKGTEALLDGMGMEHIYNALVAKADELEMINAQQEIMDLAQTVRRKRVEFQQTFYQLHIKKEAPTAGTVSTSLLYKSSL